MNIIRITLLNSWGYTYKYIHFGTYFSFANTLFILLYNLYPGVPFANMD